MEPEEKSNGNGALVGSVIIIIILILGGIYLLKTSLEQKPVPQNDNLGLEETLNTNAEI